MTLGPEQRAEAPERRERAGLVRRDLLAVVRADLASAADPDRAVGQQRYMKSVLPFYGLTSPRRRAVLRPLWGDPAYRIETEQEWEATVRAM